MKIFNLIVIIILFSIFYFLLSTSVSAQAQPPATYILPPLPPGQGLNTTTLAGLLVQLANFLIGAGIVIAIIVIVWSGIMYLKAGDKEANITKAKGWFRNGIIGAFIILAVGVIILTIYNIVVTGSFFGGSGTPGGPGIPGGPGQGGPGSSCLNNSQCLSGTVCDTVSGICVRNNGNLEGEICKGDGDCAYWLRCKSSGVFGTGQKTCQQP